MLKVVSMKVLIANGGGELDIEIEQNLLPSSLEKELIAYLCETIPRIIDSWPGWLEIEKHQETNSPFTVKGTFH